MSKTIAVKTQSKTVNDFVQYLKGLIVAMIITFACILIFALIIKFANLTDKFIVPVNLAIKALAISIGTIVYTKSKQGGLKKGIILAVSYITLAFVVFSALAGHFNFNLNLLIDYLFGIVVGVIIGVVRVNAK